MNLEQLRNYCLSKPGVTEGFPFDEETLVFKVMEKMFALTNITPPFFVNLKCDPEKALELREEFEEVTPGYHMSKKHWNTIDLESSLRDKLIREWIDDSYNLVAAGLKKSLREELAQMDD